MVERRHGRRWQSRCDARWQRGERNRGGWLSREGRRRDDSHEREEDDAHRDEQREAGGAPGRARERDLQLDRRWQTRRVMLLLLLMAAAQTESAQDWAASVNAIRAESTRARQGAAIARVAIG